jgi:hypothetical protein
MSSYNSLAGAVSTARLAQGFYGVKFGRLAPNALAGNLQVTAVEIGGAPRRCKPTTWSYAGNDYTFVVSCYDPSGRRIDSAFTLSYHHKTAVSGVDIPPAQVAYVLAPGTAPPGTNLNSGSGTNTVTVAGPGVWKVTYPTVGARVTHMQVTAFDDSSVYCQLADVWSLVRSAVVAPIACFRPGGALADGHFFATYSSG